MWGYESLFVYSGIGRTSASYETIKIRTAEDADPPASRQLPSPSQTRGSSSSKGAIQKMHPSARVAIDPFGKSHKATRRPHIAPRAARGIVE